MFARTNTPFCIQRHALQSAMALLALFVSEVKSVVDLSTTLSIPHFCTTFGLSMVQVAPRPTAVLAVFVCCYMSGCTVSLDLWAVINAELDRMSVLPV